MPGSPNPSATSTVTSGTTPKTRKIKTIAVIRRPHAPNENSGDGDTGNDPPALSKKTKLMVARQPRPSEGRLFEDDRPSLHTAGPDKEGNNGDSDIDRYRSTIATGAGKLRWLPDGHVVEKSILGTAAAFEEIEAQLGWAKARAAEQEHAPNVASSIHSLQSQRSKQSLRSSRSGGCQSSGDQSIGGPTSTASESRLGTVSENKTDLQKEMEVYFLRIVEAEETATRNKASTSRKEAKLMEHVGLTEKLTMRREGNAMRQWKRRQRDWHRVSEDIAAKSGKAPEALVMSTADDFRERREEYDLIQGAIPTHEKHSSDGNWLMSLRGYGERTCNVGNIFSGLFCAIDDKVPPLRAVRKPTGRPADATRNRTWRDSEALTHRKRNLAPALKLMRPQELRAQETDGLLVQGQDLLEWAATSSTVYFEQRRIQELEVELAGTREVELAAGSGNAIDYAQRADTGFSDPDRQRSGPVMEVNSPSTLLITSTAGCAKLEQAMVNISNTGCTVLFFSWSRIPTGDTIVSLNGDIGGDSSDSSRERTRARFSRAEEAKDGDSGNGGKSENGARIAATTRHAALQDPEGRFFCYQTTGTLLPGETAAISFSFKSADPGIFSDRWRLTTVPPASFIFTTPPSSEASHATHALGATDKGPTSLVSEHNLTQQALRRSDRGSGADRNKSGYNSAGLAEAEKGTAVHTKPRGTATEKITKGTAIHRRSNQDDEMGGEGVKVQGRKAIEEVVVGRGADVGLRGVAMALDTRGHARKKMSVGVERGILAAKIEEIVRGTIRGVRTPVREEEVRRRQREAFLLANADQGLYFTPRLYDAFMSLLQRAKAAAAAAEAGTYDVEEENDSGKGEITTQTAMPRIGDNGNTVTSNANGVCSTGTGIQRQSRQDSVHETCTVGVDPSASKAMTIGSLECGKFDENGDDEDRSSCSTRPPSDGSSTGGNSAAGRGCDAADGDDWENNNRRGGDVDERRTPAAEGEVEEFGEVAVAALANGAHDRGAVNSIASPAREEEPYAVEQGEGLQEIPGDDMIRNNGGGRGERVDMEILRGMLQRLNCGEWNGAVATVLQVIEGLSAYIPTLPGPGDSNSVSPADASMAVPSVTAPVNGGEVLCENDKASGGGYVRENEEDERKSWSEEQAGKKGDEEEEEEDEDEEEEEGEEDEEDDEEEDEEEEGSASEESGEDQMDEESAHPLLREQRALRARWCRLVLDAQVEPETDCHITMCRELSEMVGDISSVIEGVRLETRGTATPAPGTGANKTPRGNVLGYDEESVQNWTAACPAGSFVDVEGGPRMRAAAASKAGNLTASFLALAYGAVSSRVAATMERVEEKIMDHELDFKNAASSLRRAIVVEGTGVLLRTTCDNDNDDGGDSGIIGGGAHPFRLSRLAALSYTDIENRRLLLHVDLSTTKMNPNSNFSATEGDEESQIFSQAVRTITEQVRNILSAKPVAVAIVSEMAPYPPIARASTASSASAAGGVAPSLSSVQSFLPTTSSSSSRPAPFPVDGAPSSSLRATTTALSSLLGMEVEYFESVPEMALALRRSGGDGVPPFGARLMMAERLSLPGVVPAPPREEPELSDGEEEVLPDFAWDGEEVEDDAERAKEAEAARLAADGPGEGDLGAMLAGVIDVVVLDAPRTMYEPRREVPWGPVPTTGLTVAGSELRGDLTAMAYLTECPERPLLAIVGGESLESRLKLIDGLLDLVDILAIGGGLAATFIAATNMNRGQDVAFNGGGGERRKRKTKWGPGTAGAPRDLLDVLEVARRLLVKARKRGVEVLLPSDFVVGDIAVDENGPLPGQLLPNDDQKGIDGTGDETDVAEDEVAGQTNEDIALMDEGLTPDGGGSPTDGGNVDGSIGGSGGGEDVAAPDAESEDLATGFEYDGETIDVALEDGIPKGFSVMDVGPATVATLRDAVGRARAILWHGMLGVAECSAFQFGTRELLGAVTAAYDSDEAREAGRSPVVVLCGSSLKKWAEHLVEGDDDGPPLGAGSGVSHVCAHPGFCTRVLEGRIIPGLSQLSRRDPPPGDADLGKVLRRRPSEEDEEEEDEEGDGTDADSSDS